MRVALLCSDWNDLTQAKRVFERTYQVNVAHERTGLRYDSIVQVQTGDEGLEGKESMLDIHVRFFAAYALGGQAILAVTQEALAWGATTLPLTGSCAGHPNKLRQGDLLIASKAVEITAKDKCIGSCLIDEVLHGCYTRVNNRINQQPAWWTGRPISMQTKCAAVLSALHGNPAISTAIILKQSVKGLYALDIGRDEWPNMLKQLRQQGLIGENNLQLTQPVIQQWDVKYSKETAVLLDEQRDPKAFLGVIGMDFSAWRADLESAEAWDTLPQSPLALDMASAAMLEYIDGHNKRARSKVHAVIVKGITNYANATSEEDHPTFAAYAAEKSARWIVDFLQLHGAVLANHM